MESRSQVVSSVNILFSFRDLCALIYWIDLLLGNNRKSSIAVIKLIDSTYILVPTKTKLGRKLYAYYQFTSWFYVNFIKNFKVKR